MRTSLAKNTFFSLLMLFPAALAWGQGQTAGPRFEIGGGVVGSFYDKKSFTSTVGNAEAGFDTGYGASAWVGHNMYPKISGEIRYDFLRNDMKLDGSGSKATFGSDSHAVHYDVLFHFTDTTSKVRPFVLAGGGMKLFRGTGAERAFQPLSVSERLTPAFPRPPPCADV